MRVYYNEIDRYCCDWLQNLMDAGLITPGKIDDRSIADVSPEDVRGYSRVHFFAGIAGWDLALRLAGWPDDRPVWTGSCPCQPFSAAGKGKASGDERHLWPEWFRLIRAIRPPTIFGEQVEAAVGWGWLDLVHSDLEAEGYAVGSAVLPACGIGAPHIRQRLWFVADADGWQHGGLHGEPAWVCEPDREQARPSRQSHAQACTVGELAHSDSSRCRAGRPGEAGAGRDAPRLEPTGLRADGGLGNAQDKRCKGRSTADDAGWQAHQQGGRQGIRAEPSGSSGSHWSDLIWLPCTDGKQRPTQSGIFPLAHGVPARVAKLRAAGNAINPWQAVPFIKAAM